MTIDSDLDPAIIVIFGITGDLAQRKLLPALYHLMKDGLLDERTRIVGITRRDVTSADLLEQVELCVNEIDKVCDPRALAKIHKALTMHQMSLTDGEDYDKLLQMLNDIETSQGVCMNRLYYLSIPPQMFEPIVKNLGKHGLNASCAHGKASTRLLIEKPFGYDLASAHTLIDETAEWFDEKQLFRIDHYVAKETVQNILAFRMYNPLFSTIWDSRHISAITITAYEQIGIENRAVFYEEVGALRDFIQSHLLQLLAVVTMELPENLESSSIHAARLDGLENIRPIGREDIATQTTRGQYDTYTEEVKNPHSFTETYAAIDLQIDSSRWQGTDITLRTGKAMATKQTDIQLTFIDADSDDSAENDLLFRIQPNEGISLKVSAKKPGFIDKLQEVVMDFNYKQSFEDNGHPDAYERVLVDAVRGDHTLFTTSQEVIAAWRVVEEVVQAWSKNGEGLIRYKTGSNDLQG